MSEILAPCGGMESLSAAINAGADAVYVGMKRFSARKNAENFSDEELFRACSFCHRRGVKLYAALNTLIYDDETEDLARCVAIAAECGVDGLIIQDLGAAEIARRICPELPRHASTQMTLNSACGVRAAEELGFSRVVIGRELSFAQIKQIAARTSAELEVFVHGALCVSVSGQCYMSSVFGGRSGNRGLCAQPCRLDFTCRRGCKGASGVRHNVISLKDGSIIEHLKELEAAGIASFKIEGRMKRPEYVACAVDACRKALSGLPYDKERLSGIFSRGGLTESYFDGTMADMSGIREKEDVERSASALVGIKALYKDELPRFRADITVTAQKDKPLSAWAESEGLRVFAEGAVPAQAESAPATPESIAARMSKLGGTPFYSGNITATADEGLYIPASELNALRRELCGRLSDEIERQNTPRYTINALSLDDVCGKKIESAKPSLRAEVQTASQLEQALELPFELIYAPIWLLDRYTPHKERICVTPPLVLADCEDEMIKRLKALRGAGFTSGTAHTVGHALLLRECGFDVRGSYRMNILNSVSAKVCERLGFKDLLLSFEGTAQRLAAVKTALPRGILAYGRLPLMALRRCPVADGKPCGRSVPCGEFLTDRRGNRFPVLCQKNSVEILNPDVLVMSNKAKSLEPFDFFLLRFTDETELKPVFDMYRDGVKPEGKITSGLYFRGAE